METEVVRRGRLTAGTNAAIRNHQWSVRPLADVGQLVADAVSKGLEPEDLDELVHDSASQMASAINNGGLDDQIVFLVEQFGNCPADLKTLLGSEPGGKSLVPKIIG